MGKREEILNWRDSMVPESLEVDDRWEYPPHIPMIYQDISRAP